MNKKQIPFFILAIRLLVELADASEVQGVSGAQTRSVHEALEDAIPASAGRTFGATQQFAAAVELCKKSIVTTLLVWMSPLASQARPCPQTIYEASCDCSENEQDPISLPVGTD